VFHRSRGTPMLQACSYICCFPVPAVLLYICV
jgi:hypothetical protein